MLTKCPLYLLLIFKKKKKTKEKERVRKYTYYLNFKKYVFIHNIFKLSNFITKCVEERTILYYTLFFFFLNECLNASKMLRYSDY